MKRRCKGCREWKEFDEDSKSRDYCKDCLRNRLISPEDEQIFRMVNENFEGLSLDDAAWELATSDSPEDIAAARKDVVDALARVDKIMKKLHIRFPNKHKG